MPWFLLCLRKDGKMARLHGPYNFEQRMEEVKEKYEADPIIKSVYSFDLPARTKEEAVPMVKEKMAQEVGYAQGNRNVSRL